MAPDLPLKGQSTRKLASVPPRHPMLPSGSGKVHPEILSKSDGSLTDFQHVHTALCAVGLDKSSVSLDDFEKLYRGPMGEALLFLSQHMQGRKAVKAKRVEISRIRQLENEPLPKSKSQSKIKQPSATVALPGKASIGSSNSYVRREKAFANLSAAQRSYDAYRKDMSERQDKVEHTQEEIDKLKANLQLKRNVALALDVLEKREAERVKRFVEIKHLVAKLRTALVSLDSSSPRPPVAYHNDRILQDIQGHGTHPTLRISNTRDTLSNLQTHHIRLSKIVSTGHASNASGKRPPDPAIELRRNIARNLRTDERKPEVQDILQRFLDTAKRKAKANTRYPPLAANALRSMDEAELTRKTNKLRKTELALQRSSDRAIALLFLCENLTESISTFQRTTAPSIGESLTSDGEEAKGYVDVLRYLIVAGQTSRATAGEDQPAAAKTFQDQVKEVLHLHRYFGSVKIVQEVQRLLEQVHRRQSFLKAVRSSGTPSDAHTSDVKELLASYDVQSQEAEERSTELLKRKTLKADYGYKLVDDVECLLKEMKVITGGK